MARKKTPLFTGSEWNFKILENVYDACEQIALGELKLDVYPNQIEVITSEQMLDAYSSVGLPIYYKHWSFGKQFSKEETEYRKGRSGLAYEIVINSSPCINYLMEENTITTQACVIAHAAFGHNHFFKNNYLFKEWTDAEHIIDYLTFARNYIEECEEKYGADLVEKVLDSCHALSRHAVNKYKRPSKISMVEEKEKQKERQEYLQSQVNDLWDKTVPEKTPKDGISKEAADRFPLEPEENLLYFIEKNSPILEDWQREILRITRRISQYFYPQMQTKIMNEGWATFSHHYIMNSLYDKDLVNNGTMIEFAHLHSNVLTQFDFTNKRYSGFNPYKLGFEMFHDIKRICVDPTEEDVEWFPDFAGCNDWLPVCLDAVASYRDESFIRQFLSPAMIRKWRLFELHTKHDDDDYKVNNIHNKLGYKNIRNSLADMHEINNVTPDIQVWHADLKGDRVLRLRHTAYKGKMLDKDVIKVLEYIKRLWGYKVVLETWDNEILVDSFETTESPQLIIGY